MDPQFPARPRAGLEKHKPNQQWDNDYPEHFTLCSRSDGECLPMHVQISTSQSANDTMRNDNKSNTKHNIHRFTSYADSKEAAVDKMGFQGNFARILGNLGQS